MKWLIFIALWLYSCGIFGQNTIDSTRQQMPSVQVALLLDTSNSMDGLINQAKARLWNVVHTLSSIRYQNQHPITEIALYQYGNDFADPKKGFIEQVLPFTSDLDLISSKLFSLKTRGGAEYCGQVIQNAVDQLQWQDSLQQHLKLIYIAGNEPFDQGPIDYGEAMEAAKKKKITVHTIYCGEQDKGIEHWWENAACLGNGTYFYINHNESIQFHPTPFDIQIIELNHKLNQTYIPYGEKGSYRKHLQLKQDEYAQEISEENLVNRILSKATFLYQNPHWDLVDAMNTGFTIDTLDLTNIPEEYLQLSLPELKAKLIILKNERKKLKAEIATIGKKRSEYLLENNMDWLGHHHDDLGKSISESLTALANINGFEIEK